MAEEVARLEDERQAARLEDERQAARLEDERQAVAQTARNYAQAVIDALPDDEWRWFLDICRRPSLASEEVQRELYDRLMGVRNQSKMTIEQAVEDVRSQITRDYRSAKEEKQSRARLWDTDDFTDTQDSDLPTSDDEDESNSDDARENLKGFMDRRCGRKEKPD